MPEKIVYNIISKYFDPRICSGINECSEELIKELCKTLHQQFLNYYRITNDKMSLSERLLFESIQESIEGGFEYNMRGGFDD